MMLVINTVGTNVNETPISFTRDKDRGNQNRDSIKQAYVLPETSLCIRCNPSLFPSYVADFEPIRWSSLCCDVTGCDNDQCNLK